MIRNQWYAIIPSNKIPKDKLVGVKRLNLDLCLFRNSDGDISCVADKCTHRGASLSKGKRKGDCVECPFHGLQFNKEGKCTLIPANGRNANIESRFHVESFLVREAHKMVYLWLGDKEMASDVLPFFNEFIDDTILLTANNSLDHGQQPKLESECSINPQMNLRFKFPNVWQNYITDHIKVIIFFAPVDDEHTIFYIRFYTNQFKFKLMNHTMAQIGKVMNKVVERQDKQYVETQTPKASALSCGENLLSGDSPIMMYRAIRNKLQNDETTSK